MKGEDRRLFRDVGKDSQKGMVSWELKEMRFSINACHQYCKLL